MKDILHPLKRPGALCLAWLALTAASPAATTADRIADLLEAGKPIEAFALAQQKAGEGDPEGDFALGWFYGTGEHLTADKPKAAEHFRKCAEAGLSQCQFQLGVMLDTGDGVAEDPAAAFAWLSKAAAQGDVRAQTSLAVMHANGRGTPVDFAKAMQLYEGAARKGDAQGFYGIGVLHFLGQGVPADGETAVAWFSVAAALDDEKGREMADRLLANQKNEVLDRVVAKANALYAEYIGPLLPPAPKAP
ncbi:MAG TPA: tetratricopeptide repeat protein [Sphingopyxis sp.]|nr:tetratricopeptide repeat protein [Sphingopyxis sp.]HMP46205.1 tetratricopeptide repeat protein [Sphingopyxis sp.]HMQ19160.1 tetratricopeptide repeat protein [Sphingopyxis sp.]